MKGKTQRETATSDAMAQIYEKPLLFSLKSVRLRRFIKFPARSNEDKSHGDGAKWKITVQ